jgi:hypothetical protein
MGSSEEGFGVFGVKIIKDITSIFHGIGLVADLVPCESPVGIKLGDNSKRTLAVVDLVLMLLVESNTLSKLGGSHDEDLITEFFISLSFNFNQFLFKFLNCNFWLFIIFIFLSTFDDCFNWCRLLLYLFWSWSPIFFTRHIDWSILLAFRYIFTVQIFDGLVASIKTLGCLFVVGLNLLDTQDIFFGLEILLLLLVSETSSEVCFEKDA